MNDNIKIKNAIISVHDKTGIKYFYNELQKINPQIRIFSSGGTYKELKEVATNLIEISEHTGFAEMPEGLVKTLHPKIHGGILGNEKQEQFMKENGIEKFDLVIINLYPFSNSMNENIEKARTNIDIGGVSLIEAGCKNFLRVCVITSPRDYERFLENLWENNGETSLSLRLNLATVSLHRLAKYLTEISEYFALLDEESVKKEYLK